VENRTRTYQTLERRQSRLESIDDQFESELPPEVRAELEISPRSISQPPVRIPETEQEIEQALEWLKSQGYFRPTIPAPPPVSPPQPLAIPAASKPAQDAPRSGTGIWLLLATLIGLPLLLARVADNTHPQSRPVEVRRALPPPVAVRRALPAVPRALPVTSPWSTVPDPTSSQWQPVRFYDGTTVQACYQGELPSSAALPTRGRFIGEEWSTGNTSWIWMTPAGASFPSWVDP
jgi:hypothetical protein